MTTTARTFPADLGDSHLEGSPSMRQCIRATLLAVYRAADEGGDITPNRVAALTGYDLGMTGMALAYLENTTGLIAQAVAFYPRDTNAETIITVTEG